MTAHRSQRPRVTPLAIERFKSLREWTHEHGYPPTFRELLALWGLRGAHGVWQWIMRFQDFGWLVVTPGTARGLAITPVGEDVGVPRVFGMRGKKCDEGEAARWAM